MTSESPKSPAISLPKEKHTEPLPQIPVNSVPISAVPPSQPQAMTEFVAISNGVVADQVINEIDEPSYFNYLDGRENADKLGGYKSEFKRMILTKYFSGRNVQGVDLFEAMTTIGGETIMSSRWPCTRTYANPGTFFADSIQHVVEEEEEDEEESMDSEISPGEISNGGTVS